VPIDPEYPQRRVDFMLADAGVSALLTQSDIAERLNAPEVPTVVLDTDWDSIARQSKTNPQVPVTPVFPAYLLYTSGSTGQPKGALISHAAICNHMFWMQDAFPVDARDAVLQKTPISFDASVWEFYAPLLVGGRLVLAQPNGHQDSGYLCQAIARFNISVLQVVPTLLQMLLEERAFADCRSLRRVYCGGEALPAPSIERFFGKNLAAELLNVYGPTEACIHATVYACEPGATARTPIGQPIANAQVYVLDRHWQPALLGVPGELGVSGAGLGDGYLNRPGLTAASFIPHPFGETPGARLYLTGDGVTYRDDGHLIFLGRLDQQTKVRGVRIELGEIEATLAEYPGIARAVVLAREDTPGDKRLVAYVTPTRDAAPFSPIDLRHYLAERLADYMVPSAFVKLDEMPLLPNGKVNRRALPAPDAFASGLQGDYVAPSSPTEQLLAAIWSDLLKVDRVGVHDNFFDMGGHSILATRVISRTLEAFGVELPLRCIFESPTIAGLVEHIHAARESDQPPPPPLTTYPRDNAPPLSYAQQRLWFLARLDLDSIAYNMFGALKLEGRLHSDALERALNEIAQRHEALRTCFPLATDAPVQQILPQVRIPLSLTDLTALTPAEQDAAVLETAVTEARRPFDLNHAPLLRANLLQLAPQTHVLVMTAHHIIFDGWSLDVLFRELGTLYQAFVEGKPSPLPPLAIQYADYAQWQQAWLEQGVREQQLNYWRQQLAGLPPLLNLPTDRPRPAVQTFHGAIEYFTLDADLSSDLQLLSHRHSVTLFMTLLTGFVALLARYSGQEDIAVGAPVANRNHKELESLLGFFVNTLVLRADLSADPTFVELLGRVRKTALDAYAHQDLPFEQVVEALQTERNLSHSPLFQTVFVLQNAPMQPLDLAGLTLEPLHFHNRTAKFDLVVSMEETSEGLSGWAEYNTDLFDRETIADLLRHFEALLAQAVADPARHLSRYALSTKTQTAPAWTAPVAAPAEMLLHRLFEQQAERRSDAVALIGDDPDLPLATCRLTYGQLNVRANRLANYLRAQGVGPETRVAVLGERSPETVIGVLAIVKAGGTYVPLDPAAPAERLAFLFRDAGVTLLLAQHQSTVAPPAGIRTLLLDDPDAPWANYSARNLDAPVWPRNTAYVIYTSGSTGKPKGVQVTHANAARLFSATQDFFRFDEHDVWTLFHSLAFDFSVWELWGPLLSGGSVMVIPYWVSRSSEAFLDFMRTHRVSVLNQTPSAFARLIEAEVQTRRPMPAQLRWVIFGGEALDPQLLAPWFERHGDRQPQLVNMYGITETTVHATRRLMSQADPGCQGSLIGQPLADLRIDVLDAQYRVVPTGVPGEIYIAGPGVARGYLHRPGLTAERFMPDPAEPGARCYRSGDRARWTRAGELEYLGRVDHQIKIRGFRIEPGEIEAALNEHPQVSAALALVSDDGGVKRLVAYVQASEPMPSVVELRALLKDKLPDYMIPAGFVVLASFPLTLNGKIDRRALPAPDFAQADPAVGYAAPANPIETALAALWSETLGVAQVGVNDNFFELGGDSILSILLSARAAEAGLKFTPKQLFQNQTIAELARVTEAAVTAAAEQGPVVGPAPLTPIQRRFFEQTLPEPHHFNQSVCLETAPDLDEDLLAQALRHLLIQHDILRARYERHESGWRQILDEPGMAAPLTVADLADIAPEQVAAAIAQRAARMQAGLRLESSPLLNAVLYRLGPDRPGRLLIVIHHLIVDGVSWRILLEDLSRLYQQLEQGETPALPPKTTSFKHWASRQAACRSALLAAEGDYWLALSCRAEETALPVDFAAEVAGNTFGASESFAVELDADATRALLHEAPRAYNTQINDMLLTALLLAYERWTGARVMLVDLEGHGREVLFDEMAGEMDVSRTVGWFTSIYPVALTLDGSRPEEALKSVKEQLRAIPNNGAGYGWLRYGGEDDATAAALRSAAQSGIAFNYLGQTKALFSAPPFLGLAQEPYGPEQAASGMRPHLIDVTGAVVEDRLRMDWVYCPQLHRREVIERFANDFLAALQGLVAHCVSPAASGFTPSDLPGARLAQADLDKLSASIKQKKRGAAALPGVDS